MKRIAVCVSTYNRNEGLRRLLESLENQRLLRLSERDIVLVVVDNSIDGNASALSRSHANASRFQLRYVRETSKGVSRARNAALHVARDLADYAAFIDDDEVATPEWLENLHTSIRRSDAAAAVGPVTPLFEAKAPAWAMVGGFYRTSLTPHFGFVDAGYTGNAIIDLNVVRDLELHFDEALNELGGEDTFLFRSLLDAGHRIAWAEDALVYERISAERARLKWLLLRWYRTGNIEARLGLRRFGGRFGTARNATRGLARVGAGSILAVAALACFGWRNPSRVIARLYTVSRGGGLIAAALNRDYREYAKGKYR